MSEHNAKAVALDTLEVVVKTAISSLPIGGPLITSIIDAVKGNVLAKRQQEWHCTIENRLSKIETTLEDIGNNELFTTALIKCTELAMKTAQKEKINYLANAVLNSLTPELKEERMMIFIELLERYTCSHIKIINFFHAPTHFNGITSRNYSMGAPVDCLFEVYPELDNNLFKKIYRDLYSDGMVSTENLYITMTGNGMVQKRTTELGDEFLTFIMEQKN